MSKRVCCLYRVSTGKQVDYDKNNQADIPMQRKACHKFALKMGWEIVHEEQEDGVSGHKVRAENRDKIQIIKDLARKKKFDVLLVFMFDRIGRIADETPFVVEWFVKNGIEVWSTQEGEQRFDTHTDKLLNYIRFWQADGESEKTSIRTKTSLGQLVESGHYKGGGAAFGYDLVKSGRFNKRKHELYDLKINEAEAIVVKIIFDKYTKEGYGAHRITTWLNNNGYRARTGKMWHEATIRGILGNLTYTGVLRSGDSRSDELVELQIISPKQFERAKEIMKERSDRKKANPTVPLNTKGKSLVSGKVFCGHCGSRLTLTTSGRFRKRKDGTIDDTKRIRYACYGKTRKQTDCDGQTGYTMHILDSLVEKIIKEIFAKVKGVSKNEVINLKYADELKLRNTRLNALKSDYTKEFDNLNLLKSEVIKAIKGESAFSNEILSQLIAESESKCNELLELCSITEKEITDTEELLKNLSNNFDELISWAELYDDASFEQKKMILGCLIKRIKVFRDYKLKIDFNINFEQFINGLDCIENAA